MHEAAGRPVITRSPPDKDWGVALVTSDDDRVGERQQRLSVIEVSRKAASEGSTRAAKLRGDMTLECGCFRAPAISG